MIIKIYNNIPDKIKKDHTTYNKFKKALSEWLLEKCFYTVQEYFNDIIVANKFK